MNRLKTRSVIRPVFGSVGGGFAAEQGKLSCIKRESDYGRLRVVKMRRIMSVWGRRRGWHTEEKALAPMKLMLMPAF